MYEETNNLNEIFSEKIHDDQMDKRLSNKADIQHLRAKIKNIETHNLELVEENQNQIACVEKENLLLNKTNSDQIIKINDFINQIRQLSNIANQQQLSIENGIKENNEKLKMQQHTFDQELLRSQAEIAKRRLGTIETFKTENLKQNEIHQKNMTDQKENYEKIISNLQTDRNNQNNNQARALQDQIQKLIMEKSSCAMKITEYSQKVRSLDEEILSRQDQLNKEKKEYRRIKANYDSEIRKNEDKALTIQKNEKTINNLGVEINKQKDLNQMLQREKADIIAKNIQESNAQSAQLKKLKEQTDKSMTDKVLLIEKLRSELIDVGRENESVKHLNEQLKKKYLLELSQAKPLPSDSDSDSDNRLTSKKSTVYIVGASSDQSGLHSKKVGPCGVLGCNGRGNTNGMSKTHRVIQKCPNNKIRAKTKINVNMDLFKTRSNIDQTDANLEMERSQQQIRVKSCG